MSATSSRGVTRSRAARSTASTVAAADDAADDAPDAPDHLTCCVCLEAGAYLHSSTFQLNLSALYGIGGARRGCAARVGGGVRGCLGCVWCFLVSDAAQVELRSGRV